MFSLLYVDDEPDLLEIAKIFLERKGEFTVTTCTSAAEALTMMQETTFDVVISDYQMPEMDGITFLKKIRETLGAFPFILFTGRGREEVAIEAINNGADFYLQKGGDPISQFAELAHQVRRAIRFRQDEQLVRTNEERLRKAQTIGKIGSWEYTVGTEKIWASDEGFRIFGYLQKSGEVDIELIESCIPERARVHQALVDLIEKGTAYNLEYEINPADGNPPRTVASIASLDRNARGDPVKVVGVVQDITEREQMERALQVSEERFRSIFEKGPLGMALVDESFHFIGANPAFCTLLGYTEDQLLSMTIAGVTHPDEIAMDLENIRRLKTGDLPVYSREKRYIRRDGAVIWGSITVQAIRDNGGAFLYNLALIEDITDRKRADDELRAAYEQITADEEELRSQIDEIHESQEALICSEQRYRTIIDNAPLGMQFYTLRSDRRLVLTGANPAADAVLGLDHSALIDRSIEEIVPVLAGTDLLEQFCKIARAGGVWQTDLEIPQVDNGNRTYAVCAFQISMGDMVVVLQDVTEIRRAERNIRDEQEKLQSITDTVPGAVYRYAMSEEGDRKFLFISKGVEDLLGISQETVLNDSLRVWDLVVPEDRQVLDESISQAAETGQPWEQVVRIRRDDGTIRWIQGHSSRSRDNSSIKHMWDGTLVDITAYKQTEAALTASESRYRGIVEASPDMVWEIDTMGRFTYISPQSTESLGYNPADLVGRSLFSLIPADALPSVQAALDQHLKNQEDLITLEVPAHHHDGRLLTIEIRSSPIRNDQGKTIGFRGIARDITELKQVEDALRKGNRQLTLLSSIIRHDIMNKTAVMQGYLEFAKDEALDRAGVATLIENLEHVTAGIRSQIEFATLYQDLGVHDPVWHLLTEILPINSVPATIQFQADLDGIEVYADPMLEEVFTNLLDNSIRHGGKVTVIRVFSIESDDNLVIVWEDDGVGVPEGEKEVIFQRGYGENTGFGTFLIRELLAVTNCTITETGIPGVGARFEIVVPPGAYRRN